MPMKIKVEVDISTRLLTCKYWPEAVKLAFLIHASPSQEGYLMIKCFSRILVSIMEISLKIRVVIMGLEGWPSG